MSMSRHINKIISIKNINDLMKVPKIDGKYDFTNCIFEERADLTGADLKGADFKNIVDKKIQNVDLTGADLIGADLRGITIKSSVLMSINLQHAKMQGAIFEFVNLNSPYLEKHDKNLPDTNLSFANLEDAKFKNCFLIKVNLQIHPISNNLNLL